jgi:hypothetical protein
MHTDQPGLQRAMQLYEKNGFCRSGKVSDFFGMNLFEYVKVLKVEDPPDRAGLSGIAGGVLKGTDG